MPPTHAPFGNLRHGPSVSPDHPNMTSHLTMVTVKRESGVHMINPLFEDHLFHLSMIPTIENKKTPLYTLSPPTRIIIIMIYKSGLVVSGPHIGPVKLVSFSLFSHVALPLNGPGFGTPFTSGGTSPVITVVFIGRSLVDCA